MKKKIIIVICISILICIFLAVGIIYFNDIQIIDIMPDDVQEIITKNNNNIGMIGYRVVRNENEVVISIYQNDISVKGYYGKINNLHYIFEDDIIVSSYSEWIYGVLLEAKKNAYELKDKKPTRNKNVVIIDDYGKYNGKNINDFINEITNNLDRTINRI